MRAWCKEENATFRLCEEQRDEAVLMDCFARKDGSWCPRDVKIAYSPAIIIEPINTDPQRVELFRLISVPTASMA